ncbi:MAG TPA: AMP phosphorylase [Methanothermococcus okinawensis]|uniref:AMP phosphorylase n=1 Tax=Methanofervidicoccus abyssi TaxID=2082189 RepID=A0A401HQ24_9EURY|nr:AMP phosphorylase [Methanofervidicoccus abyssi]GBF36329.1 AMP phosphorylase [Methanofervidicoccus abyssi]HIP15978.1 AMP phosphorylase [Methanothermococcus okinawensis]
MLFFKAKLLDIDLGNNGVIANERDLIGTEYYPQERVLIESSKGSFIGVLYTTKRMVKEGELGISRGSIEGIEEGEEVRLRHAPRPQSLRYIKKKMEGQILRPHEIHTIVDEIVQKKLSNIELTSFIVSTYIHGMEMGEIVEMAKRMGETGDKLEWDKHPVVDVHSIGGVPGNKYALITVPIVASAGIVIPKTSSRAITSAAGTADVMEVLTRVNLNAQEIKRVVKTTNGCLVWGGGVNLAPADDIIINVERPLSIDPQPQLLSSVIAKKIAAGINYTVIDIPVGPGTKIKNDREGYALARKFIELGERVGIAVECAITYGGQPIGRAVGPALEAKEALMALEDPNSAPKSLIEKSLSLAGILLELGGVAQVGSGMEMAKKILYSGKALEKFKEIVIEQGGGITNSEDVELGKYFEVIPSPKDGYVVSISNKAITNIAKEAGAPMDKKAGVLLYVKRGSKVNKGDILYRIYSSSEERLRSAVKLARRTYPVRVEGMVIRRVSKF